MYKQETQLYKQETQMYKQETQMYKQETLMFKQKTRMESVKFYNDIDKAIRPIKVTRDPPTITVVCICVGQRRVCYTKRN